MEGWKKLGQKDSREGLTGDKDTQDKEIHTWKTENEEDRTDRTGRDRGNYRDRGTGQD